MQSNTFMAIGECMLELSGVGPGLWRQKFAGDTFNTAWHFRRETGEDWEVQYFTAVGDDHASHAMRDFMNAQKIGTRFVQTVPGKAPGLYMIHVDEGERSFSYWRDQSAARDLADDAAALKDAFYTADALYFSGITLAVLPPKGRKNLLSALAEARGMGKTVAFDTNIRPRLWQGPDDMRQVLMQGAAVSDIVLPGYDDEALAFGDATPADVAQRYAAQGAGEVVVKNGGADCTILTGGDAVVVPGQSGVELVDTTGAGDSFNGGYLAARLSGADPVEAAQKGHRLAARVIGSSGALV
ncbi:MAG: 2-dehydro-3-deoxygluconokinase [Paracoccaceae bacterium]|jgi:2-dehydro-3-deoxygluconokinase